MVYLAQKLMANLVKQTKLELANVGPNSKPIKQKSGQKVINLDYVDNFTQKLFSYRQSENLSSRIKFKIQDLIDAYNKEWRFVIAEAKSRQSDNEGFRQIYVPKDSIMSEEQVFGYKDKKKEEKYIYLTKTPAKDRKQSTGVDKPSSGNKNNVAVLHETKPTANKMASLLSALKADDDHEYNKYIGAGNSDEEEDEDIAGVVERRKSQNNFNLAGINFQKYHDEKPFSDGVRREILNMFNEYKELEDKNHAKEELLAICNQYKIERYQFVGYFLSNALAEKPNDFRKYISLVFEIFHVEEKLLDKQQMVEAVNVCVACLPDLIIDYPNAKTYAQEIFSLAVLHKVMTAQEEERYNLHI